jgi:ribosomal protein L12E/L44/L45/RPP1/RPP2
MPFSAYSKTQTEDLAVSLACLMLHDIGTETSADNINAVVASVGLEIAPYWGSLFSKLLSSVKFEDVLTKPGSGGGGGAAAPSAGGAPAAAGKAAAKVEEKKEEEEEDAGGAGGLFGGGDGEFIDVVMLCNAAPYSVCVVNQIVYTYAYPPPPLDDDW